MKNNQRKFEEPRYVDLSANDEDDLDIYQEEDVLLEENLEDEIEDADEPDMDEETKVGNPAHVGKGETGSLLEPEMDKDFTRQKTTYPNPVSVSGLNANMSGKGSPGHPDRFKMPYPRNRRSKIPAVLKISGSADPALSPLPKMLPEKVDPTDRRTDNPNTSDEAHSKESDTRVPVSTETLMPEWYILEDIIESHKPLPEGSIILGIDTSGKPLVLSLSDSFAGSLLFMGDSALANRKHVQSVLASAEALNQPEILQIDVITPNPESFASNRSNLRHVCPVDDDGVFSMLGDYLSNVEQRLRADSLLPFHLLVLDQVETLTERLAEESLRFLRWIIRRGPQAGIWPLASIASDELEDFDLKTYKSFGFHVYGKMTKAATVTRYTKISPQFLRGLTPGTQGCFMIEEDIVSFSIPEIAD